MKVQIKSNNLTVTLDLGGLTVVTEKVFNVTALKLHVFRFLKSAAQSACHCVSCSRCKTKNIRGLVLLSDQSRIWV